MEKIGDPLQNDPGTSWYGFSKNWSGGECRRILMYTASRMMYTASRIFVLIIIIQLSFGQPG